MIDSGTSRRVFLQACAAAFATRSLAASTQVSSDGSVTRFILGSPPGSALDVLCRRVADQIQPGYSRNAVVETRSPCSCDRRGVRRRSGGGRVDVEAVTIGTTRPLPHRAA